MYKRFIFRAGGRFPRSIRGTELRQNEGLREALGKEVAVYETETRMKVLPMIDDEERSV